MDDRGIAVRLPERQEILLFSKASKPALGAPTSLLFSEYQGLFSWRENGCSLEINIHTSTSYQTDDCIELYLSSHELSRRSA